MWPIDTNDSDRLAIFDRQSQQNNRRLPYLLRYESIQRFRRHTWKQFSDPLFPVAVNTRTEMSCILFPVLQTQYCKIGRIYTVTILAHNQSNYECRYMLPLNWHIQYRCLIQFDAVLAFLSLPSPHGTLNSDCTKFCENYSEFAPNRSASVWRIENKCFRIEYCLPLARYQPLIRVNKRMRHPTIPPLRNTLHSICLPIDMFSIYLFLRAVPSFSFLAHNWMASLVSNVALSTRLGFFASLFVFQFSIFASTFHFTFHCRRLCIPLFETRKMFFINLEKCMYRMFD